jgi:hypothetical protein
LLLIPPDINRFDEKDAGIHDTVAKSKCFRRQRPDEARTDARNKESPRTIGLCTFLIGLAAKRWCIYDTERSGNDAKR